MSTEGLQESLFEEPIGVRLRNARERLNITMEAAGSRLRLPVNIIEAMENEDWDRLGVPLYSRSYLNSYCKLLDIPNDWVESVVSRKTNPSLNITRSIPRESIVVRTDSVFKILRWVLLAALILAAVIFVPRWLSSDEPSPSVSLEPPVESDQELVLPNGSSDLPLPSPAADGSAPVDSGSQVNPASPQAAVSSGEGWSMNFKQESWAEFRDAQGALLEAGVIPAGQVRNFPVNGLGRVSIGNLDGVEVRKNGQLVDLSAFKQGNVARFKVSSTGEPESPR
jgi:cytoskeleton protein RodZ